MATILFNPGIPEAGLRFETIPQVITNLQNTAPPWVIVTQVDVPAPADVPGFRADPGQPIFDAANLTYTNTWVVTELDPDYYGLRNALVDNDGGLSLMDRAVNRQTPALTLTPAGSRGTNAVQLTELYTALDAVNGVYAIERTTRRLVAILERFINEGDMDNANRITGFQNRLSAWVEAVGFNAGQRTELRGYLDQFAPLRGYLVP